MAGVARYVQVATEEQIAQIAERTLEKTLIPYYRAFKFTLLAGLCLTVTGSMVLAYSILTGSPVLAFTDTPVLSYLAYVLLSLTGLILIVIALFKKIRVSSLDLAFYPIVAVPYGDGSRALLVDVLGGIGDLVEVSTPRVDHALKHIEAQLNEFNQSVNYIETGSISKDLMKTSNTEGISTWLFEEKIANSLLQLVESLRTLPTSTIKYRLLKPAREVPLYEVKLYSPNRVVLGYDYVVRISAQTLDNLATELEPLKLEYIGFLHNCKKTISELTKRVINAYYSEVERASSLAVNTMFFLFESDQIPVCPVCLSSKPLNYMYTKDLPIMNKSVQITGDLIITYSCPVCRTHIQRSLSQGDSSSHTLKPVSINVPEYLQVALWTKFYNANKQIITSYIERATKRKMQVYMKASRHVNLFMKDLRKSLIPLYMNLAYVVSNVTTTSQLISRLHTHKRKTPMLCSGQQLSAKVLNVLNIVEDLIGPATLLTKHVKELEDARKLKTNKLFNEVLISKVSSAFEIIGDRVSSEKVKDLYTKMEYEDLLNMLKGESREVPTSTSTSQPSEQVHKPEIIATSTPRSTDVKVRMDRIALQVQVELCQSVERDSKFLETIATHLEGYILNVERSLDSEISKYISKLKKIDMELDQSLFILFKSINEISSKVLALAGTSTSAETQSMVNRFRNELEVLANRVVRNVEEKKKRLVSTYSKFEETLNGILESLNTASKTLNSHSIPISKPEPLIIGIPVVYVKVGKNEEYAVVDKSFINYHEKLKNHMALHYRFAFRRSLVKHAINNLRARKGVIFRLFLRKIEGG